MKHFKSKLYILTLILLTIITSQTAMADNKEIFYDSITNSKQISINTTYTDSENQTNYLKYYKLELTQNGVLELNFTHSKLSGISETLWTISLINDLNKEFKTITSEASIESSTMLVGLPIGKYYIKITPYNVYTNTYRNLEFNFNAKFTASEYFEKEFNDNINVSNEVVLNKDYTGQLQRSSDVDFYSFTATDDGYLSLDYNHEKLSGVSTDLWKITILNNLGKVYKSINSKGNVEKTNISIGLLKGKYYISIEPYNIYQDSRSYMGVAYKLSPKYTSSKYYEKEFNDNIEVANITELNKKYTGSIQSAADIDCYSFSSTSNGLLKIGFKHEKLSGIGQNCWKITLMNEFKKEFQVIKSKGDVENTSMSVGLPPGKYYIIVQPEYTYEQSIDLAYDLELNFAKGENYEKEFNDSIDVANYIKSNINYGGILQRANDEDYYSFDSNGTNSIKFSHDKLQGIGDSTWQINIISKSNRLLQTIDIKGNDTGFESGILPKGRYYVQVKSYANYYYNAVAVKYNLNIKLNDVKKQRITSKNYMIDNKNAKIWGVSYNTSVKEFIKNIKLEKGMTYKIVNPLFSILEKNTISFNQTKLVITSKDKKQNWTYVINFMLN